MCMRACACAAWACARVHVCISSSQVECRLLASDSGPCTRTCPHMHMHMPMPHMRMHACTCARMHLCTHAPVHACTCARMHLCTHAPAVCVQVECRLLASDSGRQPEAGYTSGYTSSFKAIRDAIYPRFHHSAAAAAAGAAGTFDACASGSTICPALVADAANSYTVSYGISLATRPQHGAVWLDVALGSSSSVRGLEATFTPPRLVYFSHSWNDTQRVTVQLWPGNLSGELDVEVAWLDVIHTTSACDESFLLHPELASRSTIEVELVLPEGFDDFEMVR